MSGSNQIHEITMKVCIDTTKIDAAIEKTTQLIELMKEAKILAGKLASEVKNIDISINI